MNAADTGLDLLSLPPATATQPTVRDTLEHQAELVRQAHSHRRTIVPRLLRGHGMADGTDEQIFATPLPIDDARLLVAYEHGYRDWQDATAHGADPVDPDFEAAADAVVTGDLDTIRTLLAQRPALTAARSTFPHHATLLHHVAANGIEHSRQRSPSNAVQVAEMLLAAGADPDAQCDTYGGQWNTPIDLLVSSSPPADAGVQADLVEVLCTGGASPDGPDDDGAPLWTAISWGYTDSVRRLVACGARVDNLIFAAVAGDLAQVASYFGTNGQAPRPRPLATPSAERVGRRGPALDPNHTLEYALIYAASHGRTDIAEFLLTKQPDLHVKEPVHGATALGAARYPHPSAGRPEGSPAVVSLLEAAQTH